MHKDIEEARLLHHPGIQSKERSSSCVFTAARAACFSAQYRQLTITNLHNKRLAWSTQFVCSIWAHKSVKLVARKGTWCFGSWSCGKVWNSDFSDWVLRNIANAKLESTTKYNLCKGTAEPKENVAVYFSNADDLNLCGSNSSSERISDHYDKFLLKQ